MLTPEERALLTQKQDELIELFVRHKEAAKAADWDRVRTLEAEIDDMQGQAEAVRRLG
jgi:hypothetical protein